MNKLNNFENFINHFYIIFNELKKMQSSSIEDISTIVQEKMFFLGQKFLESWFSETIGTGFEGSIIKDNEVEYRYNGLLEKNYITILGNITLKRAYYYSKEKNTGFYPIENKYSFLKDMCFPEVKDLICYGSCEEPYEKTKELLNRFSKINVSTSEIQKITKEIGRKLVKNEENAIKTDYEYMSSKKIIDKLVISMDGAMINTYEGWKEVKSGVIYEVEKGKTELKSKNKTFVSRIEDSETFGNRMKCEARKRNYLEAKELIVIGDGARWIWELANKEFPRSIKIIDWYHAKEHIYNIIELLYGNRDGKEGNIFAEKCSNLLYDGKIKELEEEIRELNIYENVSNLIKVQTEIDYFKKNEEKMQYKSFEEKGYPIGSGIIEATCKQLVQLRLKRNGMKWEKEGAHCVLQIRCHYLSNRWDEVKNAIKTKSA